ncbi:MAG TPA: HNH endonuclease [Allosphingosinicella sp.]|jgi:5-methylcytosine-specific restriction endonuclease McrA|nr:HNH endonuclease [Allosphingosinicella sp.]
MSSAQAAPKENPAIAARPCLEQKPYRMLVFSHINKDGVPLYFVAKSPSAASSALKALKEAHKLHGGDCFYCRKAVPAEQLAIDHAEPLASGGKDDVQNLLIACKDCNGAKGRKAIEVYKPEAGREWLSAVLKQVQDRLNRLEALSPPAPPQPKPGAAAGP